MTYVLEKISLEDHRKIFSDLSDDSRNINRLLGRGGHFENYPELTWAIDRINNNYLFLAPRVDVGSPHRDYNFYCGGHLYRLLLEAWPSSKIVFKDSAVDEKVKRELVAAFDVYGHCGRGEDPYGLPNLKSSEI